MKKKIAFLLALCLMLGLALAGCSQDTSATDSDSDSGSSSSGSSSSDSSSSESTGSSGRTDLNLSFAEAVDTLDPHYTNRGVDRGVQNQIYEPLYYINDDTSERPMLATGYTVSDDALTYTFSLREGVKFHDGSDFKSSDVVFSYERSMASSFMLSYTEVIDSVKAVDDHTFSVTLKKPCAPFMQFVACIPIISEAHYNAVGEEEFKLNPCGTGAYTLADYQQAASVTLQAFPDYWGGKATIETVYAKVIPDTSTALVAFEAGELDYISLPSANWEEIQSSGKYGTKLQPTLSVTYITMNHEVEPFDNKLVRQAINYAINEKDVLLMAAENLGKPAYTMTNPDLIFGATDDCPTYPYNPEKAKELLVARSYTIYEKKL